METEMLCRYLIFPSRKARQYMCVCAAHDNAHALKIARQLFTLGRDAYAIKETEEA